MPAARPVYPLPSPLAVPLAAPLPLQGVTVLAVEDSRFASEALRLMCQRAGARLRRAETLEAARRHLRVYQPDAAIVDLGLPDGPGEALIAEMARSSTRPGLILGTSGDPSGATLALRAGAAGFLEKPLESYAAFRALLAPLERFAGAAAGGAALSPDPLALADDLRRAAGMVATGPDAEAREYLRGFLGGIARHAHDAALAEAARGAHGAAGMSRLAALLSRRLDEGVSAFPQAPQGNA